MLGKPKHTIHEIKEANHRAGYFFFSPDTMQFFGDKMGSFEVVNWKGSDIVYRRPGATVNVFGERKRVSKNNDFFGAWKFNPVNGDVSTLSNEDKEDFKTNI